MNSFIKTYSWVIFSLPTMLQAPQKLKFTKSFSRRCSETLNVKASRFKLGNIGLLALQSGRISAKHLESTRKFLRGILRKDAKTWISVFPQLPITKKPQEVRMGKGKGSVKRWVFVAKKGQLLFETRSSNSRLAYAALNSARVKLPIKSSVSENNV